MLTRRSFAKGIATLTVCPTPVSAAAEPLHAKPDDRIEHLPNGRCLHTRWIWRQGAWRSVKAVLDA